MRGSGMSWKTGKDAGAGAGAAPLSSLYTCLKKKSQKMGGKGKKKRIKEKKRKEKKRKEKHMKDN